MKRAQELDARGRTEGSISAVKLPLFAFIKKLAAVLLSVLPAPVHHAHAGPGLYLRWRLGWLRGLFYRIFFCLPLPDRPRVTVGRRLSIQGRLRLRGPGHVVFGDDVIVDAQTDIYTNSSQAVVSIGDGVFLNGTRFSSVLDIRIGRDSIVSDARIWDSDFHSLSRNRHSKKAPVGVAPVVIGENVWVAAGVMILKGVSIGNNSVVACGSVVVRDVPADRIFGGNPARDLGPVPD